MAAKKTVYNATGRRKNAVASVHLEKGTGKFSINGSNIEEYFGGSNYQNVWKDPLELTESLESYDASISVEGGGKAGQGGAVSHAIARALVKADDSLKESLKKGGFLTRDPRMKERKKPGQPKARKKYQFSKR